MTLDYFKNNGLFLASWYERSRPVQLVCLGLVIFAFFILSLLNITIYEHDRIKIATAIFNVLVGIQAAVLLLQGTVFAGLMAARERTGETLDFHRNSPQAVDDKILGLMIGSTGYEWLAFLFLFIVQLPFSVLPGITLFKIVLFNVSLAMTGLFLHIFIIAIALLSAQKKRSNPLAAVFLLFLFGCQFAFQLSTAASGSFFSHLFGATAISYLPFQSTAHFTGRFFNFDFPLIAMQMIAQVPILLLLLNGIKRTFQKPNSPSWSKTDMLVFCAFVMFMLSGFFVADCKNINEILNNPFSYRIYPKTALGFYTHYAVTNTLLILATGFISSFFWVPSYGKRSKYKMSYAKEKESHDVKIWLNDGASSFFSLLIFATIFAVSILPFWWQIDAPLKYVIVYFLMTMSYIFAFAGFLEYFRLGRFRNKKVFAFTVLFLWWFMTPWFILVLMQYKAQLALSITSISPFFGMGYAIDVLFAKERINGLSVLTACATAVGVWLLAYQEHKSIERK